MYRKIAPAILVADDHSIIRFGLKLLLKKMYPGMSYFEATSYQQAEEILAEQMMQLVILDISMPGGGNIKAVTDFKSQFPETKILIFSSYPEKLYAERYLNAGADGYLHKDTAPQQITEMVRALISDEGAQTLSYEQQEVAAADKSPLDVLSDRELDVAKLLADGLGNLEISNALALQMSTVSTYKKRIFNKLDINNLSELIKKFDTLHNL